ncbi:MAG: PD-(D/E)XK nuclease family protein, partial [Lutispora sp.]|nr:PD-(D/E)XK nuclease family protein [Lutispora sp.]
STALDSKEDKLKADAVARGSKYLDWIGQALMRHENSNELLRSYGIDEDRAQRLAGDESKWLLKLWKKENFIKDKAQREETEDIMDILKALELGKDSRQLDRTVVKRLEWIYPYENSSKLPVKLSVTELKRLGAREEDDGAQSLFKSEHIRKPRFLEGKKAMGAAEKGCVMHYVMQHLELSQTDTLEAIEAQVQRLYREDYITEEWAKAVDIKRIHSFFCSSIGKRVKKSQKVFREMPFNIEVSSKEVFPDVDIEDSSEKILIQGVIDLYFIEGERLILLDYKTDYVDRSNMDNVISRYKTQIEYYEKALQIALKRAVDEKYIYLFHTGDIIRV